MQRGKLRTVCRSAEPVWMEFCGFLVSLVARNKNEIIGVSSMCAGSTYYFLLFKAVWVLHGNWAKNRTAMFGRSAALRKKL